MLNAADAMLDQVRPHIDVQALHSVLAVVWNVVADANRYFAGQEPWALKKTDPERMNTVLYVTAEVVRQAAILTQPFMPGSIAQMLDLLAVPEEARGFDHLGEAGRLKAGTALPQPTGVFPRHVDPEAE